MSFTRVRRRTFLESLVATPLGLGWVTPALLDAGAVVRMAGGDRPSRAMTLPGGDLLFAKVGTRESDESFFVTEQPAARRGSGPPKHYHEDQDEWFYCLSGEYVVEIGDRRFRLLPGDSVLGPRRVPHAFVYDGRGTGRLLVGFAPAGRMEAFFRDVERRGEYFGSSDADRTALRRDYGVVLVGPPIRV